MRTTVFCLIAAIAFATSAAQSADPPKFARVCAVSLPWHDGNRAIGPVLSALADAAEQQAEIVCLPEECVATDGGPAARAALDQIAAAASTHRFYVAANLREREGEKVYLTSYLIDPAGKIVGKYRKSHRLPDEPIALGDSLPVFDTPRGKIGMMVGSDRYWPEVPLAMALDGAELILVSLGVEAVPQSLPLDVTMRVRAIDDHVTLACANYAGGLPYLCSNYPAYTGEPLGRAMVIDRSGIVVADTGMRPGTAVVRVDLARRKDIYHLTFHEDRGLFRGLADPKLAPVACRAAKRKIKVSIATVVPEHGPNPDPNSPFARILDEAGQRGSDVILMTEFGLATDDENGKKTLALVAEKARKHHSYIIIGGLRDPQMPYRNGSRASWAYLWDRQGNVAGKYRISQYGDSTTLPVFTTDFGVVGIMICGDVYSQEIARAMAVQGAEIIFCPSQSWGPSGTFNLWMQQARAIDNRVFVAAAHLPMSDTGQRSYVIDPYGQVLAGSNYWTDSVCTADVDLDSSGLWFARSDNPGTAGKPGYLAGYYPKTIPDKRTDFRQVLLAGRRPELYGPICEKTLAGREATDEVSKQMSQPRK